MDLLTKNQSTDVDERGGCVEASVQEFRFAVEETLMGCGISLNKLNEGLAKLHSRSGMAVCNGSDIKSYIKLVRDKELARLKEELSGQS